MNFFEGFDAPQLIAGAILIIGFIIPGGAVSLLNKAKDALGLSGRMAHLFVQVVIFGISALALWVTNGFGAVEFSLQSLVTLFGLISVVAGQVYQKLFGGENA